MFVAGAEEVVLLRVLQVPPCSSSASGAAVDLQAVAPAASPPNFPYVLSAAAMDPIVAHGRSSSEEGIEIEEIDEEQKCHFPWPVYAVRSSWRATSAKMAKMHQMLSR